MTLKQKTDLREQIIDVLKEAGKPLRTPEIEAQLKVKKENWTADTFDVRDAVSELVASGAAEFIHPGYLVKLIRKQ